MNWGSGEHFTPMKTSSLFGDEDLGGTFSTQSWISVAQMLRADLCSDQVVEFPLKPEACRCLSIPGLLSSTALLDI